MNGPKRSKHSGFIRRERGEARASGQRDYQHKRKLRREIQAASRRA